MYLCCAIMFDFESCLDSSLIKVVNDWKNRNTPTTLLIKNIQFQKKWLLTNHRVQEQEGGLTKYTKRSDTIRVAWATPLTTPHVWTNHRIWGLRLGFVRKSFFVILGGPKYLLPSKTLFGLKNLTFGGVILLKLFDPSYGIEVIDFEIAIFWQN